MLSTKWSIACAQLRKEICRRFWSAARESDAISMAVSTCLVRACFESAGTLPLRVCDVLPIFIVFGPRTGVGMAKFKRIELHDAFDDAPRPVAAMAKSFADGAHTTVHRHGRGQLLHAVSGIMRIETADAAWLVPPARALWMPPHMAHRVTMRSQV